MMVFLNRKRPEIIADNHNYQYNNYDFLLLLLKYEIFFLFTKLFRERNKYKIYIKLKNLKYINQIY